MPTARQSAAALCISCLLLFAGQPPAAWGAPGSDPTGDEPLDEISERLHRHAVQRFKAGDVAGAIADWTAAERVRPTFKYAFNIALAHAGERRWVEVWDALLRAEPHVRGNEQREPLETLRERAQAELVAGHAGLALTVTPRAATVELNGRPWPAPHRTWAPASKSYVVVSSPGFVTRTLTWEHALGTVNELAVQLEPVPAPSSSQATLGWVSLGWVSMGAGIAAAGGGAVLIVLGVAADDELVELNGHPTLAGPSYQDYRARYSDLASRRDGMIGGGAAVAGAGLVFATIGIIVLASSSGDEDEDEDAVNGVVLPTMVPGGAGGAFTLSF